MQDVDWDAYARTYRQIERDPDVPDLVVRAMGGEPGSLLDVGCGEGDLLDRLRGRFGDWRLRGFEVSEFRADVARGRGHEVDVDVEGRIEGEYDVVLSQHVIEHVPDDREHVRTLASATCSGGQVYVETPIKLRGGWYFRRSPTAGWVLDPTHVREYRSIGELVAVVESAGLVVSAAAVAPLRFPLAAAAALARRVLRLPVKVAGFGSVTVPIPRYRVGAVLAQRPESPV